MTPKQLPITGVYTFRINVETPTGGLQVALRDLRRVKYLGNDRFEVIAEKDREVFATYTIVGGYKARTYVDKLIQSGYVRS